MPVQANRIIFPLTMSGNGQNTIEVPDGYDYATVNNNSAYGIKLYDGDSNGTVLANFTNYADRCVVLNLTTGSPRHKFLIVWTGAGTGTANIIFTRDPLPLNQNLNVTGGGGNVALVTDNVGLAKQTQLPAALTASGNLKTSLEERSVVGAQANAWNAAATGAGGVSNTIDLRYQQVISGFGSVDGATTITLQVSQDNVNFYDASSQVLAGAGGFHLSVSTGARYARLKSSANVTATATLAAK